MKYFLLLLVVLTCPEISFCQQIIWNQNSLELAKQNSHQAMYKEAVDLVIQKADSILKRPDFPRVTRNDGNSIIEHNPHDYVSYATYAWPNPDTPDGLPYIVKDGQANSGLANLSDFRDLVALATRVELLSLANYFTGDEKYSKLAASYIRVWFLNKDSRMNPNFNHAQVIPGVNQGRLEGIIDARFFIKVLDGVQLLHNNSNFLTSEEYGGLKDWFSEFLVWMENSEMGRQGSKFLKNNIGTAYELQRLAYYSFVGNSERVKEITSHEVKNLLNQQFDGRGAQALELRRKAPDNYSIANLGYWADINSVLENIRLNHIESDSRRNTIERAYRYLDSRGLRGSDESHRSQFVRIKRSVASRNLFERIFSRPAEIKPDSYDNAVFILTKISAY